MSEVIVGIISRKNTLNQDEYLLVSSLKDFGNIQGSLQPPASQVVKRSFGSFSAISAEAHRSY